MPASDADTHHHTRPATLAEDWGQLPANSADWAAGRRLGPYVLKRQLGKGGMGVVWLADQLQPLQREVAIKLLPRGKDNALTEIYFEVERQALAQLSHRSIAQIYDAGRLPDGALFFAMEYVPGVPLDEFLEQHDLSYAAIATLMRQICLGAHHAHQRALIHRDLKPLNILVQMADGQPLPKIIDFGVAIGALPGTAAPIRAGKAAGTPAYMSPEQKNPGTDGIDARSDVYALGAVFAECLHLKAGIDTAHDHFESTTLREGLERSRGQAAVAPTRSNETDTARLKSIPEALRAIAIKALAPNRDERYDSAAAMADDLNQWLQKRPVRAMGGGRWYATRCFVNRYRLATAASAAIFIALLIGALMALHGQNQARAAQALAEKRRDDAEQLVQFMLGDFADKLRPIGRLDLLDSIGAQALTYLSAQNASGDASSALNRARALRTLGEVQVTRQQFDQASATLAAASDLMAPWTAVPGTASAEQLFESGQIAFWRGSIAYRQHDLTATETFWRQYLSDSEAYANIATDPVRAQTELASAYNNLGTLAEARDQLDEALGYFREAASIGRKLVDDSSESASADLANSLAWIASVQSALGNTGDAWISVSEALQLIRQQSSKDPSNGRIRQREINFRYMLASYAREIGESRLVLDHLVQALRLAKTDVQADPSQPRRQRVLARIAYSLARLSTDPKLANVAWTDGEHALATLAPDALSAIELTELKSLRCLAMLSRQSDDRARLREWRKCGPSALAPDLPENLEILALQVALVDELNRIAPQTAIPYLQTLKERMSTRSERRNESLLSLQLRWQLASADPASATFAETLKQQLDAARLRAQTVIHSQETTP